MNSENRDYLFGLYSIRKQALEKNLATTVYILTIQLMTRINERNFDFSSLSINDELRNNRAEFFKEFSNLKRENPKDDFDAIMQGIATLDLVIKSIS